MSCRCLVVVLLRGENTISHVVRHVFANPMRANVVNNVFVKVGKRLHVVSVINNEDFPFKLDGVGGRTSQLGQVILGASILSQTLTFG